jgi:MFS family permease
MCVRSNDVIVICLPSSTSDLNEVGSSADFTDVGFCVHDFERRPAHAGIFDGWGGNRRAGFGLIARNSQERVGLGRMIYISTGMFGVALIFFGMSRNFWLSLLCMLFCGFGMMQQMAASNTIIQTIVGEDKRWRVMSFYTVAFVGMAPFGSLLAGAMAHAIGAPQALFGFSRA